MGNFGGFTPASRRLVTLADGRRAFAKGATTELTEAWLPVEYHAYTHLRGSFMPQLLGWDDSGERPLLLLEDLSGARWPPPWRAGDEALVMAALEELHAVLAPPGLRSATDEFTDSRHILFVLPTAAREHHLHALIGNQFVLGMLNCCRFWLTSRKRLESEGPLGHVWLHAPPGKEPGVGRSRNSISATVA